jgi:Spy/CpxP family protein refolding chaperone
MRTFVKWTLVLVLPAVVAPTARPADPTPPEGMVIRLLLLRQKSVQKELEITPEQIKKIHDFTHGQSEAARKLADLGAEERKEGFEKLAKQNKEFLENTLTAGQHARLHQITLQFTALHHLTHAENVKKLGLSDEQVGKLKDLQAAARKELAAVIAGKDREAKKEKLAKLRVDTRTKIHDILTDEQQKKVREMAGPPFEGEIIFEEEEDIK